MEKILVKKIFRCQFYLALAAMLIFGGVLWQIGKVHVYHEMSQVLDHEETYYLNTQEILDQKVQDYVSDHMTKLWGIEYLLQEHEDMRTNSALQSLCTFFSTEKLYVFGDDGRVRFSSDERAVGTHLLKTADAVPFAALMERGGDTVLNFECEPIVIGGEGLNFLAVPTEMEGCSMVLMGIDAKIAEALQDDVVMQSLLLQIPMTRDNALFAVDTTTGKLLSKTVGNDLLYDAAGYRRNKDRIREELRGAENGRIIDVNGTPAFLMTRTVENVMFVDVRLAAAQLKQIGVIFLGLLAMNIAIAVLAIQVVKRYFHKYVFSEINAIQQTVNRLIDGDESVDFHTEGKTELSAITLALNAWNHNVRHSQKKLNWVINATNPNAAMFECLTYLNAVYYSDNLREVCGFTQEQWDAIKEDEEAFKAYFSDLEQKKDENGIVPLGDKFLLLRLYQMDEDYFGILVDKTDAVRKKNQQATDLRRAIDDSETDSLTGLLNRRGFEVQVEKQLADSGEQAVMLMMDIDHFKRVNDVLGHPTGDILLQKVGKCLKRQFRKGDLVARLGGDEFTVFLPNISDEALEEKLNSLMEALRRTLSEYAAYHTSMSIGIARVSSGEKEYGALYKHADKALYTAKQAGKNRYEFFEQ